MSPLTGSSSDVGVDVTTSSITSASSWLLIFHVTWCWSFAGIVFTVRAEAKTRRWEKVRRWRICTNLQLFHSSADKLVVQCCRQRRRTSKKRAEQEVAAIFQQNSDRGDYGCMLKVSVSPPIFPIIAFLDKYFPTGRFSDNFPTAKNHVR